MRRSAAQSLTAVAVLFGLALFGAGPQARAGFIPSSSAAALAGAGESVPADHRVWPRGAPKSQDLALPAAFGPRNTGGAGSNSSGPTTSGGQAGLAATIDTLSPPPIDRLNLVLEERPLPIPPSGTLEPPRRV